jgi:hypothetical protein
MLRLGTAYKTSQCNYNAGGNIIITSGTNVSLAAASDWRGTNGKETIRPDADDSGRSSYGLLVRITSLRVRLEQWM